MVVEYLKKLKNSFQKDLDECNQMIYDLEIQLKENLRFISLLEESEDLNYEAFSPRAVNFYQKNKIAELKEEQKNILSSIESSKENLVELQEKIDEVNEVISEAKLLYIRKN